MKKGQTTIILFILVVSIFGAGFAPTQNVSAYQALASGDQLFYTADFSYIYDYDLRVLFQTDLSPSYNSYWDIAHNEMISVEEHSYDISSVTTTDNDLRHTWKYQDTYRNDYWDYYYYDYILSNWVFDYSGSNTNLNTGADSYLELIPFLAPIINLDFMYIGSMLTYTHTTSQSYTVNGITTSYTVDVYSYVYADSGMDSYSYYNIFCDNYFDYSYSYTYFVDSSTGFVLECEYIYDSEEWSNFADEYSTSLGTNITRDYYSHDFVEYHWYLDHTTAGLSSPVVDADLPGLEWDWFYNYDMTGDSDYVTVYFWLYDASLMDLEIYLDGNLIDTIYGISSGYHFYDVYVGDVPVGPNSKELRFKLTDLSGYNHNAEYYLWMYDIRIDWPQINGPNGEYWYELGKTETLYWQLTDANFDPQFFEFKFNGTVLDSGLWFDGKSFGLNLHDNIFSVGNYTVHIYAIDTMGHESYLDLTIHALEAIDTTSPTVTNPADIYMKPGESKEINWVITDDNPSSFKVKRNGTVLIDQPWSINNFNVNVSLDTLSLGTWIFEIEVKDSFGNINYDTVYVYVTEEGTSPTEPSGSNTVTLDAPGLIFAVIGFLSITALTVYVKKRK